MQYAGINNIIQFPQSAPNAVPRAHRAERSLIERLPIGAARNRRLREKRREVWREADTLVFYYSSRMNMLSAISRTQRYDLPEGKLHMPYDPKDWACLVELYRAAIAKLLLAPAYNKKRVEWKERKLEAPDFTWIPVARDRVQVAIAEDLKFLSSQKHRSNRKSRVATGGEATS